MKLMTKFVGLSAIAVLVGSLFFFSAGSQADLHSSTSGDKGDVTATNDTADIARVRKELSKMIPQVSEAEILATDAQGVYRMGLEGTYTYVYSHGDFLLLGDLYNTDLKVNVGDQVRNAQMASLIEAVPTSKMIVFGPKDAKRHITVFTDIDCSYCRKLHNEVPDLVKAGVQVRYLAFPRAGVGSGSYKKYVSVWCSDDQQDSLTTAKSGGSVPAASCDNPVTESYQLGQQVGVRGTPTIILDDGTVTPGYLPHSELLKRMGVTDS